MVIDKDSYKLITIATIIIVSLILLVVFSFRYKPLAYTIAGLLVLFNIFVVWFHRVPDRKTVGGDTVISSVADGKVVIVDTVYEKEFLKRDCIQVSIYMDFFDVHANFWPMTGEVCYYQYHPGNYKLAFLPKASELNEHSSTAIRNDHGEILFKQIAGTFARRIVCYSQEGMKVKAGEQCGIIKFGSRIDMYLPLDADVKVKVGDYTRASETVIAVLK